jgi:membrane-bound inhibitor of C-type lysozyme
VGILRDEVIIFGRMRMGAVWRRVVAGGCVFGLSVVAGASDLTIPLQGTGTFQRKTVKYQCDANGVKMGLPAGVFVVEYLNEASNHLAVVPVKGSSMIFVTVPSGSGAKYAAQEFVWWEAGGRGTTFASDFPGPKASSTCKEVQ